MPVKMTNFKIKGIDATLWILGVISTTIVMVWFAGMISEIAKTFNGQDYSFFMRYAEISLTLFGFTLVGAIFEKKNLKDGYSPILKKLFVSSLTFLASAIGFLFLYSVMFIPIEPIKANTPFAFYFVMGLVILFAGVGFIGFLTGIMSLFSILLNHLKEYIKQEESEKSKQEVKEVKVETPKLDKGIKPEIVKHDSNDIIIRLTLIGLFSALAFGIQQFMQDKKISTIGNDLALRLLSDNFFSIILIIFMVYLVGLALEYTHFLKINLKYYIYAYDLGIFLFFIILFDILFIIALINLFMLTKSTLLIQILFVAVIVLIGLIVMKVTNKRVSEWIKHG